MYARLSERPSSPDSWDTTFRSRSPVQEYLSLWRLRTGIDARYRAMAPALAPGSCVLDVGCGLGTWTRFLRERGHQVHGIDFSVPLLTRAQGWAGKDVRVCAAAATHLPFKSASFDLLFSWGVVEHDEKGPTEALQEFRRVVKPGGKIYVTVPLDSERERQAELVTGPRGGIFYEYHFRPGELVEQIEEAGFHSVKAVPVTKSPHLAAPRFYRWLSAGPSILRDAGIQLLKPATWGRDDCFHMLLGMGTVPETRKTP